MQFPESPNRDFSITAHLCFGVSNNNGPQSADAFAGLPSPEGLQQFYCIVVRLESNKREELSQLLVFHFLFKPLLFDQPLFNRHATF